MLHRQQCGVPDKQASKRKGYVAFALVVTKGQHDFEIPTDGDHVGRDAKAGRAGDLGAGSSQVDGWSRP